MHYSSKKFLEFTNEINKGNAKDSADLAEFEQIQPTCTGLIITHECLRFAECSCHVNLAKAGFGSELTEQRQ
jgi:hypothetical protein